MTESLDAVFRPDSVAVIGASRRPGTIGWQIVDNLVRHGYTGALYPVNPNARAVHSIAADRIGAPNCSNMPRTRTQFTAVAHSS